MISTDNVIACFNWNVSISVDDLFECLKDYWTVYLFATKYLMVTHWLWKTHFFLQIFILFFEIQDAWKQLLYTKSYLLEPQLIVTDIFPSLLPHVVDKKVSITEVSNVYIILNRL